MLELAILGFLKEGPMHGYELKQRLAQLAGHFRPVSDGALYPAIGRLEQQGYLIKNEEIGETGKQRRVMHLTDDGERALLDMLRTPSEVDISDRNRFFTILAFLKHVERTEQCAILEKRLTFLQGGKSFFSDGGTPVTSTAELDPFRKGMLLIAKETSRVEKQWLRELLAELSAPSE
ncbi:MAG: PadR family transcriptional regulator [Tumebacillaceae bacterium]